MVNIYSVCSAYFSFTLAETLPESWLISSCDTKPFVFVSAVCSIVVTRFRRWFGRPKTNRGKGHLCSNLYSLNEGSCNFCYFAFLVEINLGGNEMSTKSQSQPFTHSQSPGLCFAGILSSYAIMTIHGLTTIGQFRRDTLDHRFSLVLFCMFQTNGTVFRSFWFSFLRTFLKITYFTQI